MPDLSIDFRRLAHRTLYGATYLAARLAPLPQRHQAIRVMGLSFPSPLGIAAGFDRHGKLGRGAARLGFGFSELGTFDIARLPRWRTQPGDAVLGVNLGLPVAADAETLRNGITRAWQAADYLMLNLLSPLSAALLAEPARLHEVLMLLRQQVDRLREQSGRHVPLLVKLRCVPGEVPLELTERLRNLGYDGLLAAHDPGPPATAARYRRWQQPSAQYEACAQVAALKAICGPQVALLSVGGIQTAAHVQARRVAGADLVQLHSALLHRGPWLARSLLPGGAPAS